MGGSAVYHDDVVPACTFTHPEIASVGLTEADARERHGEVIVGSFPFQALGRARAYGDTDGFVKLVADAANGRLLGMHVIGPAASDIIAEGALALQLEATLDRPARDDPRAPDLPRSLGRGGLGRRSTSRCTCRSAAPARAPPEVDSRLRGNDGVALHRFVGAPLVGARSAGNKDSHKGCPYSDRLG